MTGTISNAGGFGSFAHHNSVTITRSLQIKEDALTSFTVVTQLNAYLDARPNGLSELDIPKFQACMHHVASVYNSNMEYIFSYIKKHQDEITFKEDRSVVYSSKTTQNECTSEDQQVKEAEEFLQIKQLLHICISLKNQIGKLNTYASQKVSDFTPVRIWEYKLNADAGNLAPRLRMHGRALNVQPIAFQAESQKVVAAEPPATTPTTSKQSFNASIQLKLTDPQHTLGICCAPEWADNPILFQFQEESSTWAGNIPPNVEYKFILLKDGKIDKWEQGINRTVGEESTVLTLIEGQVKF